MQMTATAAAVVVVVVLPKQTRQQRRDYFQCKLSGERVETSDDEP